MIDVCPRGQYFGGEQATPNHDYYLRGSQPYKEISYSYFVLPDWN
jgi:hypothetical protein